MKGIKVMKKSIRNLVVGVVAAIGVFGTSAAAFANTQYVQTGMNFRNGPSTSAAVIGSVPAGAQVDVQGNVNGWDVITYNGQTGYIHGGNVGSSYTAPAQQTNYNSTRAYFDNNFAQAAATLPESGDGYHTVVVDSSYLALRSAPTYDASNEIGQLYTGDLVQRTSAETFGSYIQVYSPKYNAYGYVNAGFVR